MKNFVAAAAVLVVSMTCIPTLASAAAKSPQQIITSLDEGRKLRIELADGTRLTGCRGKVSGESFTLEPSKKGTAGTREVRFDQIETVSVNMSSAKKVSLIAGISVLALVLVGLIFGTRV
jgi:hypothetical protein